MVMVQATLATQLQNMTPTGTESVAITNLVDAYGTFASTAAAGAALIPAANVTAAKAAMTTALSGLSSAVAAGAAGNLIASSIQTFWVTAVVPPWPPAVAGVPPPNAGLAALLTTTFGSNTGSEATLVAATAAMAADMFAQATIGGTMNIPPPPAGTPTPIL